MNTVYRVSEYITEVDGKELVAIKTYDSAFPVAYSNTEIASYIVQACNNHDALVGALRDAENWLGEFSDGTDDGLVGLLAEMRAALAQVSK